MTKAEKEIIIQHYAECKTAYGFYLEQLEHTTDKSDRISVSNDIQQSAERAGLLHDLMVDLDIKTEINYTEIGRKKYRETFNIKENG